MRLVTNNWRVKLTAVFIAFSTWGVVAYAHNPVDSRDFARVPIQAGPLPSTNWVIVNPLPPVAVTLSGLQAGLARYDPKNLHALVDLSHARQGLNEVKVRVDVGDPAISATRVVPDVVTVQVDEKDVTTKKIEVRFKGTTNSCCTPQRTNATALPDTVRLSGPKTLLARANPFVMVDLTEATSTIKKDSPALLDGISGPAASLVTVEPAGVAVTVPVSFNNQAVPAVVNVITIGSVASGYEVGAVTVTPQIVTIEGAPSVVGPITSVDTDVINLNGATSDFRKTVSLRLPGGVTVAGGGPSTVQVHITVNQVAAPTPSPTPAPTPTPRPSPSP